MSAATHRAYEAVAAYVGRRGAVLLIFGTIWLAVAYGILTGASEQAVTPNAALFHVLLPIWIRVTLWGGCALLAILAALAFTPRLQAVGYVALFLPPAERALSYLGGWVVSVFTDGGAEGAWVPGLTWMAVAIFVIIEARTHEQWPPAAARHTRGPQ
jgi:hypothetical protein